MIEYLIVADTSHGRIIAGVANDIVEGKTIAQTLARDTGGSYDVCRVVYSTAGERWAALQNVREAGL